MNKPPSLNGEIGAKGYPGLPGDSGLPGLPGMRGPAGLMGNKGECGDKVKPFMIWKNIFLYKRYKL